MVIFDSVFPLERCFRLMLDDVCFDPYILVVPDVLRGIDHQELVYRNTYRALFKLYGDRVLSSRDANGWKDVSGKYDLYFPMNPYSGMTHSYYSIPYLAHRGNLVCLARYFSDAGTVHSLTFNSLSELKVLWRFYAENARDLSSIVSFNSLLRLFHRVVAVGNPKLDEYVIGEKKSVRKMVILAPHHSMDPNGERKVSISNFPQYADLFLELPKRYPSIDWVFRPHPLTLRTMVLSKRWTQAECDKYVKTMCSYPNVRYEDGGSYLETFAQSDGLIQDCASFLPEYFFTKSPQCFILKNQEAEQEQFLDYGREMLSYTYRAYSEQDVINFIENVVIAGNDSMKEEREKFAKENLMFNYPHAAEAILDDIKKSMRLK